MVNHVTENLNNIDCHVNFHTEFGASLSIQFLVLFLLSHLSLEGSSYSIILSKFSSTYGWKREREREREKCHCWKHLGSVWFGCLAVFHMRLFGNGPFCHISFKCMHPKFCFTKQHFERICISILKCTLKWVILYKFFHNRF